MLQAFSRNWKRVLLIVVSLLLLLFFLWLFLRPWLDGVAIPERTGTLQNSQLRKKAFCEYWETTFLVPIPQKPPEILTLWLDPKEEKLIKLLNSVTLTGEIVKVKYQRDVVHRFWACTPSDYNLLSIERIQTPDPTSIPLPDKRALPSMPDKPISNPPADKSVPISPTDKIAPTAPIDKQVPVDKSIPAALNKPVSTSTESSTGHF